MDRIAFVFSGQGDQRPGMGSDLYQSLPTAKQVFDTLDALRPGTKNVCFEGTKEELLRTENTQPCLFAFETAAAAALNDANIKASSCAGFSLGELSALCYAHVSDLTTCFELVCQRAKLMQATANKTPARMVAALGLDNETIISICSQFEQVYPVNFNCPKQITISGADEEIDALCASIKEVGGKTILLKTSGGFHSPFMNEASTLFASYLDSVALNEPQIELYSNITAKPYKNDIKTTLAKQICNPVLWEQTIRNMIASGINVFIEIGPGKTLCNLIKKIDSNVQTFSMSNMQRFEEIVSKVAPC